jgi:hypothetical protein
MESQRSQRSQQTLQLANTVSRCWYYICPPLRTRPLSQYPPRCCTRRGVYLKSFTVNSRYYRAAKRSLLDIDAWLTPPAMRSACVYFKPRCRITSHILGAYGGQVTSFLKFEAEWMPASVCGGLAVSRTNITSITTSTYIYKSTNSYDRD